MFSWIGLCSAGVGISGAGRYCECFCWVVVGFLEARHSFCCLLFHLRARYAPFFNGHHMMATFESGCLFRILSKFFLMHRQVKMLVFSLRFSQVSDDCAVIGQEPEKLDFWGYRCLGCHN